jgi:hypothetical protein
MRCGVIIDIAFGNLCAKSSSAAWHTWIGVVEDTLDNHKMAAGDS